MKIAVYLGGAKASPAISHMDRVTTYHTLRCQNGQKVKDTQTAQMNLISQKNLEGCRGKTKICRQEQMDF